MLLTEQSQNQRLAWRLGELPPVTGLSLAFWRKAVRLGWVPAQKPKGSGAIVILDRDLRDYLESRVRPVSNPQPKPQSAGAAAQK